MIDFSMFRSLKYLSYASSYTSGMCVLIIVFTAVISADDDTCLVAHCKLYSRPLNLSIDRRLVATVVLSSV